MANSVVCILVKVPGENLTCRTDGDGNLCSLCVSLCAHVQPQ